MLVYSINHLLGYDDMGMEQLKNFRQMGYRTAGHPEYGHAKGIETTTGPLGQGIANSVGFAIEDFSALRYVHRAIQGTDFAEPLDMLADPDDPRDLWGMLMRAK